MSGEIIKLVQPADPTIDGIFEEFLAEQRNRLKARTMSKYEDVIDLFRHNLNSYGHDSLSRAESALFDRYYNARGEEHREFCQLFGPDKIVENLGGFLGYFMIRKVMASEDLKRVAGTVVKKLSEWLAEKGHISEEEARRGSEEGEHAAQELPKAEKAGEILYDAADALYVDPNELAEENYLQFDHFSVAQVEPGKLWLESFEGGVTHSYGPIPVPNAATKLIKEGWDISCSLGRIPGKSRIIEMANVYPL